MRVLRGRAENRAADADATADLLSYTGRTGEPGVRVWRPHRQVAFGRRDARADGYEAAVAAAEDRGFPATERSVGGHACAYTGSTVAFARTEPVDGIRTDLEGRYEAVTRAVQRACWRLGVPAQRGEPPGSFCPGDYSLSWEGKLAGVAQRVTSEAALVSGILLVADGRAVADVLDPVYGALDVAFDPASTGSLAAAGGRTAWPAVRAELERALTGTAPGRGGDVDVVAVEDG